MIGRIFSKILKSSDEAATKVEPTLSEMMGKQAEEAVSMDDILDQAPPQKPPEPPVDEPQPQAGGEPPQPPMVPPPAAGAAGSEPPLVMPQTLGGSTRKLPNADYFTNPDTQELIRFTQRAQVMREGKSWTQTKKAAKDVAAIKDLHGKPPNERWTAAELPS